MSPSGLLLIDKPAGITAFDIIRRLRRQTGIKKMGHAGTLDPMATGLMLLLVGSATKQATLMLKLDKTYEAQITLGSTSSTGDAEGELSAVSSMRPSQADVDATRLQFTGLITQTPPVYSAIKIGGTAAYKRARRGEIVEMPSRQVTIHKLELASYDYPQFKLVADVSSGTYIRTLAQDIGERLGTGAYLSSLRRTIVGQYKLADAAQLEAIDADTINNYLMKL